MITFDIVPRGPFALSHARRFLCGFTPASGASRSVDDVLALAFLDEKTFEPTLVEVAERSGVVEVSVKAGASDPRAQVARILSLDHDASGLGAVCDRDSVIGGLFARTPGFRPVCFASPYEAAIWGVLAQRTPMPVAAANKRRLSRALGGSIDLDGATFDASPRPFALLGTKTFPGLAQEKLSRLHAVARAALEGTLEASRLRALPREVALRSLSSIRGVGRWTAEHVLVRGAGTVDELPLAEPRVARAFAEAYALEATPSDEEVQRIAEQWRPFRTWITVRLVTSLSAAGWKRANLVA